MSIASAGTEQRPSLLLVDDDSTLRERLARAFRERGWDVTTAGDYDEALAAARRESPEYAVVDLRMPGRSGLEVVRDLLTVDASTRVVVLTGYGSIATTVDAIRLGAVNYLPKPADADDLLAAFARASGEPSVATSERFEAPSLARAEWEHINRVLADCGGNISEAARKLGIHRRSLQRKLQKYPPSR
ncbi:DNA-binding response regulator, Fis family [Myxococcus xanthus DK 1622]|uniref:DNA-binding response regulator, Fis family n=1 Tax=Myxococcus xanthus (strain DK1622) TaxID=246197 RepID=Q1CWX9_MYXXD|nr:MULTISPECIES: response regulator transcription factor [Myxococcus]ABF90295.1 DNA-binding response regulator, Fis family [Myxococcus xanthus DK 1622]NOJ56211.1 response regulator transcription factor [Myxococcus xanthus]QPM79261.1 response regulator transcription factor [Myxococcus xanthus]QVW68339.1 response regulator transcription factor [Myxococcus xanthus DZ2]QZZ54583.1 Photosynthetic apparatus regulatory protein RegA [Myxococcus xanthus]